jgi:signal transduction histidine kinase
MVQELSGAKEEQSRRIAEQLHDSFGQDLLLVKIKLEELLALLPTEDRAPLAEIIAIVASLIHQTRTFIEKLYPEQVCQMGLNRALQYLAEEMRKRHRMPCTVKLDGLPRRMKDEIQQVLFRAVRELLFNVVKHARASRVKIVLARKAGLVLIEVCDNGRGFNRHKSVLSDVSIGRFGLFSIRARLAPLGGDLRIFSRVGRGTRAIITLPMDAEQ